MIQRLGALSRGNMFRPSAKVIAGVTVGGEASLINDDSSLGDL
jgi:hypothetical protein